MSDDEVKEKAEAKFKEYYKYGRVRGTVYDHKKEYKDDEGWSDEETEEQKKSKYVNKIAAKNAAIPLIPPGAINTFRQYKEGYKLDFSEAEKVGGVIDRRKQLPYVSSQAKSILGKYILDVIWDEFINHNVDIAAMISLRNLPSIGQRVNARIQRELPFDKLIFTLEEDDCVKYNDVVSQLAIILSAPSDDFIMKTLKPLLPSCCAFSACHKHRGILGLAGLVQEKENKCEIEPPFFLNAIFIRKKNETNGNLRRKHVLEILNEANIPYDIKRLPSLYWHLYGDFFIATEDDLMELVEAIRTDMDSMRETQDDMFKLPRWLMNEFTLSEIKLFIHHFQSIDLDGGGSVDAEELQKLTESLGSRITLVEAQELIDENDDDGNFSYSFKE